MVNNRTSVLSILALIFLLPVQGCSHEKDAVKKENLQELVPFKIREIEPALVRVFQDHGLPSHFKIISINTEPRVFRFTQKHSESAKTPESFVDWPTMVNREMPKPSTPWGKNHDYLSQIVASLKLLMVMDSDPVFNVTIYASDDILSVDIEDYPRVPGGHKSFSFDHSGKLMSRRGGK